MWPVRCTRSWVPTSFILSTVNEPKEVGLRRKSFFFLEDDVHKAQRAFDVLLLKLLQLSVFVLLLSFRHSMSFNSNPGLGVCHAHMYVSDVKFRCQ